ncbi:MAG: hypothetical protein JO353_10600 [Phycisphaerae bacterium]|nr:hypothetical protein [Phycisphaerae bacterium]
MAVLVLAALFGFETLRHAGDARWMMMGPIVRGTLSTALLFAGVIVELLALRQMRFVERADITALIVDEVYPIRWSADHVAVHYHYFTNDRRVISSVAAIHNDEAKTWQIGNTVPALYDAARPARHALSTRNLWAVDWELNESTPAQNQSPRVPLRRAA